jgi:hypothetical protein
MIREPGWKTNDSSVQYKTIIQTIMAHLPDDWLGSSSLFYNSGIVIRDDSSLSHFDCHPNVPIFNLHTKFSFTMIGISKSHPESGTCSSIPGIRSLVKFDILIGK